MSDPIVKPTEFTTAVSRLKGRLPVGADLSSAQWADVPLALRERAFFSARMAKATILQDLKDRVLSAATPAEFVAKARPWMLAHGLGKVPEGAGVQDNKDLRNHAGTDRLKLIYEQNIRAARGYGWWKQGQNEDVLDAFPAQELVRLQSRKAPRDWKARWLAFNGPVRDGRYVALKSDPIWSAISRFGTPWPPYDFNSGMGVDDVTREEAEAMGLLAPGAPVQGDEPAFNQDLQASVKNLDQDMVSALQASFGAQVEITSGVIHWKGDAPQAPRVAPAAVPPAVRQNAKPVSAALDVRTTGDHGVELKGAIAAIDRVHDDGILPAITVGAKIAKQRTLGTYSFTGSGPTEINVKKAPQAWPRLTTAHEIGHFLDHQALGKPGTWASEVSPELEGFRAAALASDLIKSIRSNPSLPSVHKAYLLSFKEVWARAYAQYIAETSQDQVMKSQLLRSQLASGVQWADADFKPILEAINQLLTKKGWKK